MNIYNVFPLLAGPLGRWRQHLERAAEMRFDWIFVNPIQQSGGSKSLYAIQDYFAIDRRLHDPTLAPSPEQQVQAITTRAHQLGLRMMADLVINHCAMDSPLLADHPGWFRRGADGRVEHPSAREEGGEEVVWGDLAAFDFETADREGLYTYLRAVARYLLDLGFDGFRCDAAYQVPAWFWRRLIDDLRQQREGLVFAAETLGCTPEQTRRTAEAGFDYLFNSVKWWDLESPWLLEQHALTRELAPSIGFPESHDTSRLFADADGSADVAKQRYLLSAFFTAGVLLPIGYEYGFRRPLHVVETTPQDWEKTDIDLSSYIAAVNDLRCGQRLFREAGPVEIPEAARPLREGQGLAALERRSDDEAERALLLLNPAEQQRGARVEVDALRPWLGDQLARRWNGNGGAALRAGERLTLEPGASLLLLANSA